MDQRLVKLQNIVKVNVKLADMVKRVRQIVLVLVNVITVHLV